MIYFCATSVFDLLIIVYLLETEYKDVAQNKTLILLDHVTNLMKCYPKITSSGFWNDVICIHTDKEKHENITKQLDLINFRDGDIIHLLGKEFASFYLLQRAAGKAKCIITDEGVLTNVNIKNVIDISYNKDWLSGIPFDMNHVDEAWLMDAKVSENDENIKIKDLNMHDTLKQRGFRERYVEKLESIFSREDCVSAIPQICFFDVYYLQMYHCISAELEQYLLEQLAEELQNYDFIIKPHPGERNYRKYKNVEVNLYKESYIPWEVLRFYEDVESKKKRIVISYVPSGAILHERLFYDDGTHIIFINKIYEKFSKGTIDIYNNLNKFIEIYGDDRVYFPETFAEMGKIIASIGNKETGNYIDKLKIEQQKNFDFLADYYKNSWEMKPTLNNYTTLFMSKDGTYEKISELDCYTDNGSFNFEFSVTLKAKERLRWYITRNRKVSLKTLRIRCINNNGIYDIDLNSFIYHYAEDRPDGYKEIMIQDPVVEFDMPCEFANMIVISGEWKFDYSYDGVIQLLNKNSERFNDHIKLLHQDINERDKQFKMLHNDLIERDNHLTEIYKDIKERDNHLKIVYKRLEKSEIHVALLKQDIVKRDITIGCLHDETLELENGKKQKLTKSYNGSFWHKLIKKRK